MTTMFRLNKAMPESPELVRYVLKNYPYEGTHRTYTIPWDMFVFSTREGKPYLPPTMAAGIKAIKSMPYRREYANHLGVSLTIVNKKPPDAAGDFSAKFFRIRAPRDNENTIRHELLHFVQTVGANLIMLTREDLEPLAFTELNESGAMKVEARKRGKAIPFDLNYLTRYTPYGGPKREARSFATPAESRGSQAKHAREDVEFQTDALNVGLLYSKFPTTPDNLLTLSKRYTHEFKSIYDQEGTVLFSPERLKRFYETAYSVAAREKGIPEKMPESFYDELKIPRHGKAAEPAKPPRPGKTSKPVRPAVPPRPGKPVRPPRPVKPPPMPPRPAVGGGRLGFEVAKDQYGKTAWFIVEGGKRTGKYFYSEDKASAFIAKKR